MRFAITGTILALAVAMLLTASNTAALCAQEPYDYAALWSSWGRIGQDAYLEGVVDATARTYFAAGREWLPAGELLRESARVLRVREEVFVGYQAPQIPQLVTALYKDPANPYITIIDMVFIARDKIAGKDVDGQLRDARKSALETHQANQKVKNR